MHHIAFSQGIDLGTIKDRQDMNSRSVSYCCISILSQHNMILYIMVKYWYTCLTSNVYDSMIYMITKKHDTINLIKYNIIFIRLRLLSETIFSTANPHVFLKPFCNATPRNNHRCPRDPSTTLTKWCEKHRCVHPAKRACYAFASPDAFSF